MSEQMVDVGKLFLETSKCDLSIKNEPGFEYWWVLDGHVIVMGYHPHNSPAGFICTMEHETAVREWGKMCAEAWELISCSPKMDQLIEATGLMSRCHACGDWSLPDEGYCVLCGDLYEFITSDQVGEVASV